MQDGILLAQASSTLSNLQRAGQAGYGSQAQGSLEVLVGNLITGLLGVLGLVFVILIVYAGIMYMTAGGNEQKVTKAKQIILSAVIGLVIVVLGYAITNFVIGALLSSQNPSSQPAPLDIQPSEDDCLQFPGQPGCPEGI